MTSEVRLRQQVIATAREMSTSGLSPGRSGNVSTRHNDGFLITPSGMAYAQLQIDDIVFVDLEGEIREGQKKPSSEWRFHLDIYIAFEEAGAIVHSHSRHATALACCGLAIPAFHYMVAVAGGKGIPIAPYALFGTKELSDHVTKALKGYRAALMEHHGQVVHGADLCAALELAHEVEELAAQYVLVRSLDKEQHLSKRQMDEVIASFKTYGVQEDETH